jgi:hypothetical protein
VRISCPKRRRLRAPLVGLPVFGVPFGDEQGLQLGQHLGGLGGQVVAFPWVGGEILQFKAGSGPKGQGLGGWITWGVTVVELPDL